MFWDNSKVNKKTKGRRNRKNESSSTSSSLVRGVAWGVVISLLSAFLFIVMGVWICYNLSDPTGLINAVAISAICVASTICGFVCAKICPNNSLLCGITSGAAFSFALFIISLPLSRSEGGFGLGAKVGLFIAMIALNFVGAVLGSIKIMKKRRRPAIRR